MTSKVHIGSHHVHWNTQIVCELAPEPGDIVVSKHRFSGFYGTDLEMILRGLGIEYLVFTACTTSVCVESTMRDAMFRDFRCMLLADCTAEPIGEGLPRSNHDASPLVLQGCVRMDLRLRPLFWSLEQLANGEPELPA